GGGAATERGWFATRRRRAMLDEELSDVELLDPEDVAEERRLELRDLELRDMLDEEQIDLELLTRAVARLAIAINRRLTSRPSCKQLPCPRCAELLAQYDELQ